jgi:arginine exporter protein ArgO
LESHPTTFPIAEAIGIFVGVVAWDLLSEGRMEIIKALAIAAPCSLVWYGIRYWREKTRRRETGTPGTPP